MNNVASDKKMHKVNQLNETAGKWYGVPKYKLGVVTYNSTELSRQNQLILAKTFFRVDFWHDF